MILRRHWLLVLSVLNILPLFAATMLPFTDLPEHVAVMASLAHYFDPAWRVAEHYIVVLGRSQYLLYHFVGAALTLVVRDATLANRLLLAAVGISYPFALRSLLRAFKRDERLAVFGLMIFWNRALVVGFLPYIASIPVLVYALSLFVRFVREEYVARRRLWLAVLSVVLFYLHLNGYLVFVVCVGALVLVRSAEEWKRAEHARRVRSIVRGWLAHVAWLSPSLVCATAFWAVGKMTIHSDSLSEQGEIGTMNAKRSAHAFVLWAHDLWWSHVDDACAAIFWGSFLLLFLFGLIKREKGANVYGIAAIPFACTLALYFLLPFRVGAGTMLNVRFAPVLALFAVVILQPPATRRTTAVLAALVLTSIVSITNSAWQIHRAEEEDVKGLDALLEKTSIGSRLLTLSFSERSGRSHFPPWVHVGAYHRVRHGGVAAFSFAELNHWPMQYRPSAAPPKKPLPFWDFHPCLFRNAEDGAYYDYILTRGTLNPFRDKPPGPAFRPIGSAADFVLYEKVPGEINPAWPFADEGPCVNFEELSARSTREQTP